MSRPRADTILGGAPRIPKIRCDVLESVGECGVDEYSAGGAGILYSNSSTISGRGGGTSAKGRDGGEVATHDLYGDYDDSDSGAPDEPQAKSGGASSSSATVTGPRITGQSGYSYKSDGSTTQAVNRWSIENNVALLVLKKELQIDRSAVRERRTAKKLADLQTPRQLCGSMSFPSGGGGGGVTPRGVAAALATPRGMGSATPRPMSSPRASSLMMDITTRLSGTAVSNSEWTGVGPDGLPLLYAPPPPITVEMTDAAFLSQPVKNEVDFLLKKCAELVNVAGVQEGEDIVSNTKKLHRRIQLLNGRVVEEISNRLDVTIASIRNRDSKRDLLAANANMTEKEMAEAFAMSSLVEECYNSHIDALQIIRRLHSLRMVHQEAFQRVGALSLLRAATVDTNTFVASALDEIEEMRLGTKEVDGAVNESLAYFRTRLQALAAIK